MPGNHSRSRRQFTAAGEDDDAASSFSFSRADDSRPEPLSQPRRYSHASDSLRVSPSAKSDMRNEPSSSSRRRDQDDWRQRDDRAAYSPSKDTYRRGGARDDPDDRDSDSWAPPRDSRGSGRQYSDRYDQDRRDKQGSNQQGESWAPPPNDNRDRETFSRWTPKNNRGNNQRNDRKGKDYNSNNRSTDSWGRDEPRESYNERRRDNGWASRRRSNVEGAANAQSAPSEPFPREARSPARMGTSSRWDEEPVARNGRDTPVKSRNDYSNRQTTSRMGDLDDARDSRSDARNDTRNDGRSWNRNGFHNDNYAETRSESRHDTRSDTRNDNRNDNQGHRDRKKHKNKKNKKHNSEKKAREWRADDSHLNNWTRRDTREVPSPSKAKSQSRKPRRSPSPLSSRSRSPSPRRTPRRSPRRTPLSRSRSRSVSRYSYRTVSSRGYSPASDIPRQRRDSVRSRSRSPYDDRRSPPRGRRPPTRYTPSPAPSSKRSFRRSWSPRSPPPRSPPSRGRSRERIRSPRTPLSTTSRSRSPTHSRSRSPRERSRTVHRLPVASSLDDIRNAGPKGGLQPFNQRRNGEGKGRNRANRKNKAKGERAEEQARMLPPALPLRIQEEQEHEKDSGVRAPPHKPPGDIPIKPASSGTPGKIKNAGFKPIGQQSSAVKRFFPGSDEDDEPIPRDTHREEPPLPPLMRAMLSASPPPPSPLSAGRNYQHPGDGGWPRQENPFERVRERERVPLPVSEPPVPPHAFQANVVQEVRYREVEGPGHYMQMQEESHTHYMQLDTTQMEPSREHSVYTPDISRPPSPVRHGEELYEIMSQVGEGTFGKVYKARNTGNGRFVALKRIRMEAERDGFPVTAMREIKLLQSLRHVNVVRLYEMMVSNGSVYMVFEYMDHDLTGILSQTQFSFTAAHLKSLCHQMLAGLAYLHHKGVIHRDIKGSNILINNRGELKLADFGLARFYQKRRRSDYTNRVITLWYRPPELLFGTTVYGPEVDMWSAGCIMLELFTKKPIFQGNDEIHQLDVIYKIIGTPTPDRWPDVTNLPWYELVKPKDVIPNHFRELFQKWMSPAALDLAEQLLAYDPAKRVTAAQALEAPYFTQEHPRAEKPTGLSTLEGEWHELETKRERAKKRRKTENTT